MSVPLSPEVKPLIEGPNFAPLATLMPDGSRQSAPVWVGAKAIISSSARERTP
jgi:hypothetical protein